MTDFCSLKHGKGVETFWKRDIVTISLDNEKKRIRVLRADKRVQYFSYDSDEEASRALMDTVHQMNRLI